MTETIRKGNAAEAAVLSALVERGFQVLIPFGEGQPYDLVIELPRDGFVRVQCKTGRRSGGCLMFNSRSTDHGHGAGRYHGLADVFGVYFRPTRSVYIVPVDGMPHTTISLRLVHFSPRLGTWTYRSPSSAPVDRCRPRAGPPPAC